MWRAFTEARAIASWLPPYGFLCVVHEMTVKQGGTFRMSFQNCSTGNSHSFGGEYVEIKPNEFLKYTDQFDDPNLPGEMITSVLLRKTIAGTEMKITQEGIQATIPAEMCYLGWQESLEKLAINFFTASRCFASMLLFSKFRSIWTSSPLNFISPS